MECKQIIVMLLLSSLLLFTPMMSVQASSSSSDEEDEEEASNGNGDTAVTPQPETQTQTQQQPQGQQQPLSMEELFQKYGQNQPGLVLPGEAGPGAATGETAAAAPLGAKAVILNMDDNWRSQYTYAEPIIRQYGFNNSFFIYCLGIDTTPGAMTSEMVRDLHAKGYDIESHSMTHADIANASEQMLDFEITQSKPCIQDMVPGLNVTVYATAFAAGDDNATVLQKIADSGFEIGRAGYATQFDLGCDGYYVPANQSAGCQLFEPNDTSKMKFQNRYNLPVADANGLGRENNHDRAKTQQAFVSLLNESITYDDQGKLKSLPILVYHNFSRTVLPPAEMGQSLTTASFEDQMKYLADNDYQVYSIRDLKYDPVNATFSIPKLDAIEDQLATAAAQQQQQG